MTDEKTKADLLARSEVLMALAFPADGIPEAPGSCLYRAAAMMVALRERGERAQIQAGSALWQFREIAEPEPDTFGYEWDRTSPLALAAVERAIAGRPPELMPEMHCWVAVERPRTRRSSASPGADWWLIDPSAGQFPAMCERVLGLAWELERPPVCLWTPVQHLPKRCRRMSADGEAIALAIKMLSVQDGRERLEFAQRMVPLEVAS